jgi:hypothetical protein
VKILFDNCTSPILASTLNGFVSARDHVAIHIRDAPCGRDATDEQWIAMLGADQIQRWIVVTGDGRLSRNKPERVAFRSAGLFGFVLAPAYQKTPLHQVASFLLWRWPEMEQLVGLVGGAALYELPMNRSGKLKQIPL